LEEEKKKILFLSASYDLPLPRAIRVQNLSNWLNQNYDLTIICFDAKTKNKANNDINIVRLDLGKLNFYVTNKTISGYKPKGLSKIISKGLSFILNKFFIFPDPWILERNKVSKEVEKINFDFDILICSMFPFSMGEIGVDLKRKYFPTAKLCFDIGDPLSQNSAYSNQGRLFERKENYERNLLEKADHIIVTNIGTKDFYSSHFALDKNKVSVIPQGVSLEKVKNLESKNKSLTGKCRMVYGGSFYPNLRDPRSFFELLEGQDNFELSIYGNHLPMFKEGFDHIDFCGRVDQFVLLKAYSECDIILYVDNSTGMQTSGKIFELLALKKPIIFLYNNTKSPVYLDAQNYEHILFIENKPQLEKNLIKQIFEFGNYNHNYNYNIDQFSWKSRAESLIKIIESKLTI